MPRRGYFTTLASLILVAATLAGCSMPSEVGGESGGTPSGARYTIHMKDLKYDPLTLTIPVGATVTWVNDDPFGHTVTPTNKQVWGTKGSGDSQADWMGKGDSWSFTFTKAGTYEYYCIPHASQDGEGKWRGMVATIIVSEDAGTDGGAQSPHTTPPPAKAVDVVEVGRSASDVPAPIGNRGPAALTFDITSREVTATMADGSTYDYWTFDGTVPGPMLRARVGDTITVNLHNDPSSTMGHNIDLHAVTGPGGGAGILNAAPGETATLTFKALNAGLFVYHCAYQDPPLHIAQGMYGMILIEPEGGLAPVDEEYYIVQSDFYSGFSASDKGHHAYNGDRAAAENPTFVVFNGRMGSLTGDRQLVADVGDTVRMFIGNGGPNLVSSFHVIGEIFDRAYDQASLTTPPQEGVQTTLVPAGGAAMVEFDLEVPGDFYLVDHSIFRIHKGAFGVLHVNGEDNNEVYRSGA